MTSIEKEIDNLKLGVNKILTPQYIKKMTQKSKPSEFIFNIKPEIVNGFDNDTKTMYKNLLEFTRDSLRDFRNSSESFKSYSIEGLFTDEQIKFNEKKEKYISYANSPLIRYRLEKKRRKKNTPNNLKDIVPSKFKPDYLSFQELFSYNREYTIREYMKDKDFDEKKPEDILEIFKQRISEMEECHKKHENKVNVTKTKKDLLFLEIESKRETTMIESIESKSTNTYFSLKEELKKMAGHIMWGISHMELYYNEDGTLKDKATLEESAKVMIEKVKIAKEGDENCIKKMMTFLPLSIFKAIKDGNEIQLRDEMTIEELSSYSLFEYEFDFIEEKLIEFYVSNGIPRNYDSGDELPIENGGIINGPHTQFRLGIGYDLFKDKLGALYSGIKELWTIYVTNLDFFNSCGKYVNYNIYVNLLEMYMSMINNHSVFPASFSLRKEIREGGINATILNERTQSYEFRYKDPISTKNLFNKDMKFLGVHFIKYIPNPNNNKTKKSRYQQMNLTNQKVYIHPLFVFRNTKFETLKAEPRTTHEVTTIGRDFISSHTGDEREIITCDKKMYFIEDGEITPSMSLTYHELTNILFYGAKTYMIGDNRKELYFTMLNREDPKLKKLITLLNMTEVFFIKGKLEGFTRERFQIMTKEEALRAIDNNQGKLMGNQKINDTNITISNQSAGYNKNKNKNIKKQLKTKKKQLKQLQTKN